LSYINITIPAFFFFFFLVVQAHACNPSYSGGRDQEDGDSKPVQANLEKSHKRAGGMAQGVGYEFKPQYHKKKKKKFLPRVVAHDGNPSTQEAGVRGS
jgi:hypothetical protein